MEKNRVLNHSFTQSPSLFDVPETETFASEKREKQEYANWLEMWLCITQHCLYAIRGLKDLAADRQ